MVKSVFSKVLITMLVFLYLNNTATAQQRDAGLPRIIVTTDIGGTDPDDNQSMIHLLMYSDRFDIEALLSTPSYGKGAKEEILRMIAEYEKDYPQLKRGVANEYRTAGYKAGRKPELLTPDYLRSITYQGMRHAAPLCGYETPTDGSNAIIRCARKNDARPLWVLVWGALEDVAQALHDAPDIMPKLRVYWIGGPNKKWGTNAYDYIVRNFPDLWMIENNATYRGFIGSDKDNSKYQAPFWKDYMKDHGVMGNDFQNYYKGIVKMGDTPSLLYLMGPDGADVDNPEAEHWGGQFEAMRQSPKYIISGPLCKADTVPVYSLMEWQLDGPVIDIPADSVAFTMRVDKQNWAGYYIGGGKYMVRYAPKAPATLTYIITSDIKGFTQHEGVFTVGMAWPGIGVYQTTSNTISAATLNVGKAWWTDCSKPEMFSGVSDDSSQGGGDYSKLNGKWQGAYTIAKWRNDIMQDWAKRFSWISTK